MTEALHAVKEYLREQYSTLFNNENWQFSSQSKTSFKEPVWIDQDEAFETPNISGNLGGAILDPDVGICLLIQKYHTKMSIGGQLTKSLQIRSNLLPINQPNESMAHDPNGAWRIVIYWLVEKEDFPHWIEQVATLREKSAHFEEIPIDAIVNHNNSWTIACEYHRFPRLLFSLRSLFLKAKKADIDRWQDADVKVWEKIDDLPNAFKDNSLEQQFAESLLNHTRSAITSAPKNEPNTPKLADDLLRVRIQNFRNIDAMDLKLRSSHHNVGTTVIQGPNGSGKSSIFEALSIGLFGSSERHLKYLNDPGRLKFGRKDKYLEEFLTNFGATAGVKPSFIINESEENTILSLSPDADNARQSLDKASGTIFSQEHGESLVAIGAEELGSQITAAFSLSAKVARTFIETNIQLSEEKLKGFNAQWQLRANVRNLETVIEKITSQAIMTNISLSPTGIAWLEQDRKLSTSFEIKALAISVHWGKWKEQLNTMPTLVAKNHDRQSLAKIFQGLFKDYAQVVSDANQLISTIQYNSREWPQDILEKLASWGYWLEKDISIDRHANQEKVEEIQTEKLNFEADLNQAVKSSELERKRQDLLAQHTDFVKHWAHEHKNQCYICETDLTNRGGISSVYTETINHIERNLDSLRTEFITVKNQISQLDDELLKLGISIAPISSEEQSELTRMVSWILPEDITLKEVLSDTDMRAHLFNVMTLILSSPPSSEKNPDIEQLTTQMVDLISKAISDHSKLSAAPAAWKKVQKTTISRLSSATMEFLPQTISALWLEIAKNLMPAPWQYPGDLSLQIDENAKAPSAYVAINQDTLANYILNGAEVHTLGLAWFFTKYITEGRFRYPLLVLDDPAVLMDQPTYRDFCRLAETLLRLHRLENRSLTLVCLLNQDTRAVDLARATSATLHQLKWNRNTQALGGHFRLEGDNVCYPLPLEFL